MKKNILLVLLLASLTVLATYERFKVSLGIDFYQYWGVGKAQEWSPIPLGSPAAEQKKYAEVLNAHATRSADLRLVNANKIRRHLELAQTPLCYLIFTLFPANFSVAFGIFQVIQVIFFLSAILLLSMVYYGNWLRLLPWAFLLAILYRPLVSDLIVGNLNCLHLFGFALLLLLADRVLVKPSSRTTLGASLVFMGILVFLTLMKPNWSLVTLLLVAYLWADQGRAIFARAAAAGVACGAVLLALPCIHFHSWRVWQDWYQYLQTWDSASMLARIPEGNYSAVLLVSQIFGSSVLTAAIVLAALLGAALLIALLRAREKEESLGQGLARVAIQSLRDPNLTVATGITVTLTLSYFSWFHYYIMSFIPSFWLLSPRHPWSQAHRAGFIVIISTSDLITDVMRMTFGFSYQITYGAVTLGLIPLWAGIFTAIAAKKNPLKPKLCGAPRGHKEPTAESSAQIIAGIC